MLRAVILAFVLFLSAVAPAVAGEVVHAYAGTDDQLARELFEAFEKDTGIRVEWERLSGGEAMARIEAEKDAPRAAIWVGGVGTMHIALKERRLTEAFVSAATANIPEKYHDKDHFWIGLYVGPLSICYNRSLMEQQGLPIPGGWFDLLRPEHKGRGASAWPTPPAPARPIIC